jgi:hypothetical protein
MREACRKLVRRPEDRGTFRRYMKILKRGKIVYMDCIYIYI